MPNLTFNELASQLLALGWKLTKLDNPTRSNPQYVAHGSGPGGQKVPREGRTPEQALQALVMFAQRANQIRAYAKLRKTAAWQTPFLHQLEDIGRAYGELPVYDPKAVPAWRALADESKRQADAIRNQINVTETDDPEPYPHHAAMLHDIHHKQNFIVSRAHCDHPVWTPQENVNFRIVHDVVGHGGSGGDFGWEGENLACGHHFPLISPLARRALMTECIGQTAYALRKGSHGFGPQKVGLLPQFLDPVEKMNGEHIWVPHGDETRVPPVPQQIMPVNGEANAWGWYQDPQTGQWMQDPSAGDTVEGGKAANAPKTRTKIRVTRNIVSDLGEDEMSIHDPETGEPMWDEGHPMFTGSDPNQVWAPPSDVMAGALPQARSGGPEDYLDREGTAANTAKMVVPWWERKPDGTWKYPVSEQKQIIMNAFRVCMLSPLKHLKWNAAHYQAIRHMPVDAKAHEMWAVLDDERRRFNAANGHDPDGHLSYYKDIKALAEWIQYKTGVHKQEALGEAKKRIYARVVEVEQALGAGQDENLDPLRVELEAHKIVGQWLRSLTGAGQFDDWEDQSPLDPGRIAPSVPQPVQMSQPEQMALARTATPQINFSDGTQAGDHGLDEDDFEDFVADKAGVDRVNLSDVPTEVTDAALDDWHTSGLVPWIPPQRGNPYADAPSIVPESDPSPTKCPNCGGTEFRQHPDAKRRGTCTGCGKSWPDMYPDAYKTGGQLDLMGGETGAGEKYAGFMGSHLESIAKVSKHLDDIRAAALKDIYTDGGRGYIFRNAVMNMGLTGVGPKVASFIWLMLYPEGSELGIVDTHVARALRRNQNDVTKAKDYYKAERMQRTLKDVSGYQDMPLGMFHHGMWDMVRSPDWTQGWEHSNHSPLAVYDPEPWDQHEWPESDSARFKTALDWTGPEQFEYARPYAEQVGQNYDEEMDGLPAERRPMLVPVRASADWAPSQPGTVFKPGDRVQLPGGEMGTVVEVEPVAEDYVPEECEMCGAPTENNLSVSGRCNDCGDPPHEHDDTIWTRVKKDDGTVVRVAADHLHLADPMTEAPSHLPARHDPAFQGPDSPEAINDMVHGAGWIPLDPNSPHGGYANTGDVVCNHCGKRTPQQRECENCEQPLDGTEEPVVAGYYDPEHPGMKEANVPDNEDYEPGTRVTWGPENEPGKIIRFRGYAMDHNWYVVQLDNGETVSVRGDQVHPEQPSIVPNTPPANWQQVPTTDTPEQIDSLVHHASTPDEVEDVWVAAHS